MLKPSLAASWRTAAGPTLSRRAIMADVFVPFRFPVGGLVRSTAQSQSILDSRDGFAPGRRGRCGNTLHLSRKHRQVHTSARSDAVRSPIDYLWASGGRDTCRGSDPRQDDHAFSECWLQNVHIPGLETRCVPFGSIPLERRPPNAAASHDQRSYVDMLLGLRSHRTSGPVANRKRLTGVLAGSQD